MNLPRDRKHEIIGIFNRSAATYDRIGPRFFAHFGRRLVEHAHITPGATVLDVAAGRGAVLFPAAHQAGPRGRVVGIDLSPEMVRETVAEIQGTGLSNAEMLLMDAEELQFPDASFDCVLAGFSLWFFPQPQRALAEFLRILKPGGRIGITTWAKDCPTQGWTMPALRQHLPPQRDQEPQPSRFDTPPMLEAALQQAGFKAIGITVEDAEFTSADEEAWWSSLWSTGLRRFLEQMTAPVLQECKADMLRKVQAFKQQDGIHDVRHALIAVGNKPS